MKKLITLIALLISFVSFAQEKQIELNCYNKWAAKFEDRGAEIVQDGIYEDVIITTRQGGKAICNNGKAEVRKGKVVHFYVLLSDGSHEEIKKSWKDHSNENVVITNGMSKSLITIHNELINILWPNSVKAKRAKPTAASDPTDD